jgi:signal peptide peptidase SppA
MPKYPKIMAEIFRQQWAINTNALEGILEVAKDPNFTLDRDAFHGTEGLDISAVSATLGEPLDGTMLTRVKGSVGSLLISGPIVPKASAFVEASGVASIERLTSEFRALEEDDTIKTILLVVDSPGGAVTGVDEFSSIVAGCDKRVFAYLTGMAASAAFWVASAADNIVASPTATAGSVGVILTVRAKQDEDKVEIVSTQSPKKRLEVTTEEGKAALQTLADDVAQVFVETVAKNRKVTAEKVLSDFGQGATMIASKALKAGMIDEIDTLVNTVAKLDGKQEATNPRPFLAAKETNMKPTLQDLLAQNPHLNAEIQAIEVAAREAGAAAERESFEARIKGAMPVLKSVKYPQAMKDMALEALDGKMEIAMLKGAVITYDTLKAQDVEKAAVADSADQSSVVATEIATVSTDGKIRTGADLDAEILRLRGEG